MKRNSLTRRSTRKAFTLLELLIVISIIAILISLISVAVVGAMRRARQAAVTTQLTQMETALAAFKSEFGQNPPSSITLWDTQAEWDANPEHKSIVRSLWRDFDFSTGGRTADTSHPWAGEDKVLTGDECLVFFLGGMPIDNGPDAPPTLIGFSVNDRFPFSTAGQNRSGPFFNDWDNSRLIDNDDDGVFEYADGLGDNTTGIWYSMSDNGRFAASDRLYYQADGKTPWKKETFQLIAPGEDGEFGEIMKADGAVWAEGQDLKARIEERDNITNFSGGVLGG